MQQQGRRFYRTALAIAGLSLFLMAVQPAGAVDEEIYNAMAGPYVVQPADGGPGCTLDLLLDGAIGGRSLSGAESCAQSIPSIADAAAWNFDDDGQVILIDPLRKVLARFAEQEGGPYTSTTEPALRMIAAVKGMKEPPSAATMAGTWLLHRPGGEKLCTVELKGDRLDNDMHSLSPASDCPSAIAALKLYRWQADGFSVRLLGEDGSSVLFNAEAPDLFAKDRAEGGKPLVMERQK